MSTESRLIDVDGIDAGRYTTPVSDSQRPQRQIRTHITPISSPFDWQSAWCRCGKHSASHPAYHADTDTMCQTVDSVCERCRDGTPRWVSTLTDERGWSTRGLLCDGCKAQTQAYLDGGAA